MKIQEEQSVKQMVTIGRKCDICGKETGVDDEDIFGFSSLHREWSNNESFEWHEVCSWNCFIVKAIELYEENKEYSSFKINGTPLWIIKQMIDKPL